MDSHTLTVDCEGLYHSTQRPKESLSWYHILAVNSETLFRKGAEVDSYVSKCRDFRGQNKLLGDISCENFKAAYLM